MAPTIRSVIVFSQSPFIFRYRLDLICETPKVVAKELGVGVATAHGDIHKILGQLAEKHVDEAASLRALLNLRYETLFHSYFNQAVAGDNEAAKTVMGILDRMAKINGLIPDKSLVTVDQRSMKFDQPVTFRIDELAKLNQ